MPTTHGTHAASTPGKTAILASSRVRSLAPALPRASGRLTHQSAAAGPCTARRAPVETCSPGEPCPPPRPPWGGWGVSAPSCGMEGRGRAGQGGSFGEMPWPHRGCRGRRGKMWAVLRGSSLAPCSCPVPSPSCRTLRAGGRSCADHMWCSALSQRDVAKGATVTRCLGREGQGVPWGATGPAQPWAPGGPWGASRPPLPSRPLGTSLLPSGVSQSPVFRHSGMPPGHPFPFSAVQSAATSPRRHKVRKIHSSLTEIIVFVISTFLFLPPNRKSSCRKEEKEN